MELKVQKLDPVANLPEYATDGAAAFDIQALLDGGDSVRIFPGKAASFRTGLAFEVPAGHVMLVYSRSGHGFKNKVRLSNCVGVIDSDYRGELQVSLQAETSGEGITVMNGTKIAQAMVVKLPKVQFVEVSELSSTDRGEGGFGSTDA